MRIFNKRSRFVIWRLLPLGMILSACSETLPVYTSESQPATDSVAAKVDAPATGAVSTAENLISDEAESAETGREAIGGEQTETGDLPITLQAPGAC